MSHGKPGFQLYQHAVKELSPRMGLKLTQKNNFKLLNVSTIVKFLYGPFLVGGVRFNGDNKEILCSSCGRNYKNPAMHSMLYCQETVAIRETFYDWLMDCLPIEISAMLDDDSLLYILFWRQIHCNNTTVIC